MMDQLDQAQRGLQRVRDVMVGRIHGLVLGIMSVEQVFDGIQVFVDIAVVARAVEVLVPLLDQAGGFRRNWRNRSPSSSVAKDS